MSEIMIVYWSGTGNTEMMAKAIKEGIEKEGADVSLKSVDKVSIEDVKEEKCIIFGSPAMGAEELAEEMEDFISELEKTGIKNKFAAAFGSYDWGDGEWMKDFGERLKNDGFNVIGDGLAINSAPDEEGLKKCLEYGKSIRKKISA